MVTRMTTTTSWVITTCASSGASSRQSISPVPAGRVTSAMDDCPRPRPRLIPAALCLPARTAPAKASFCTGVIPIAGGLADQAFLPLSLHEIARGLGGRDDGAAGALERCGEAKARSAALVDADEPIGECEPLAPDVIDHRVVSRGAGIG